jgi:hypothetical protein
MRILLGAAVVASFTLAPLTALACGDDSTADSSADKLGLQAPPAATKAPVAVAKAAVPKARQSTKDAKAPTQDAKLKIASTR